MTIVPVQVKSKSGSICIATYAFLDNGCGAVFAAKELNDKLNSKTRNTKLLLRMLNGEDMLETQVIQDRMQVGDIHGGEFLDLPEVYIKEEIPVAKEDIPTQDDINKWKHLRCIRLPQLRRQGSVICINEVTLMIGSNVPAATQPLESRTGIIGEPYAIRSPLGWLIYGTMSAKTADAVAVHFSRVRDLNGLQSSAQNLEKQFQKYIELDFSERRNYEGRELSVEDKKFMSIMEESTTQVNGHYQTKLPIRDRDVKMPNNKPQAEMYAARLRTRLSKNNELNQKYANFMTKLETSGYAEMVPPEEVHRDDGKVWYLPHHSVQNPKKPDKVRVVFNCPVKYKGTSLNDQLLQGPDMTNRLVGVLMRWRRESVAMMADVESMFYQVQVQPSDCDLLRYLWWPNGDINKDIAEYRMKVHVFGATSSPSVANYALKKCAMDNEESYDPEVVRAVGNDFYVDDFVRSMAEEEDAVKLAQDVKQLLTKGSFRLTKWVSNSRKVIEVIPAVDRAKTVQDLDLRCDSLPTERTLGILWNVETDQLGFSISTRQVNRATRRTILSTTSSIYDPLGLVAPFTLGAKTILQTLCRKKLGWDDPLLEDQEAEWRRWLEDLQKLESLKINRCYKPSNFGEVVSKQMHTFADASEIGYGTTSYIRYENSQGNVCCSLVMAKSRVTPLKPMTIPRLELTAATLATRVNRELQTELQTKFDETHFWTDSKTVLMYIANERTRYHTFVANRVGEIRENSEVSQWHYVPSKENPADDASRGMSMEKLLENERWFSGPKFLLKPKSEWPICSVDSGISSEDPEVKELTVSVQAHAVSTRVIDSSMAVNRLIEHFSDWKRLTRAVAWWLRLRRMLLNRTKGQESHAPSKDLSLDEVDDAEVTVIKWVQRNISARTH